jgi:hypothetical protein
MSEITFNDPRPKKGPFVEKTKHQSSSAWVGLDRDGFTEAMERHFDLEKPPAFVNVTLQTAAKWGEVS